MNCILGWLAGPKRGGMEGRSAIKGSGRRRQKKIIGKLSVWKNASDRKPLILQGARQVGKTWLLKVFLRKCSGICCNQRRLPIRCSWIQVKNEIIPIEVNSDENIRSRTLATYNDLYNPAIRLRYSLRNLKLDEGLLNVPLFMVDHTEKLIELSIK